MTAQQTLAADVTTYLGILGSLWTSVVSVADLLQTDDLFQLAQPRRMPPLPDLDQLPPLPCCHPSAAPTAGSGTVASPATGPAGREVQQVTPALDQLSLGSPTAGRRLDAARSESQSHGWAVAGSR